jgi:hypothetical protein
MIIKHDISVREGIPESMENREMGCGYHSKIKQQTNKPPCCSGRIVLGD